MHFFRFILGMSGKDVILQSTTRRPSTKFWKRNKALYALSTSNNCENEETSKVCSTTRRVWAAASPDRLDNSQLFGGQK